MEEIDQDRGGLDHAVATPHRDVSVARWKPDMGMGEVLVQRGKIWGSMGVIRNSRLYCHVEEAAYLVEQGSLLLLREAIAIPRHELYDLLVDPSCGCSWNAYQIFCHLKRLGYIVGRHDTLWSTSSKKRVPSNPTEALHELGQSEDEEVKPKEENPNPVNQNTGSDEIYVDDCSSCLSEGDHETLGFKTTDLASKHIEVQGGSASIGAQSVDLSTNVKVFNTAEKDLLCDRTARRDESSSGGSARLRVEDVYKPDCFSRLPLMFTNLELFEGKDSSLKTEEQTELNIMFDVHQPNGRFKKTAPGFPFFSLCIVDGQPPNRSQVRALEHKIGGRPLKFGLLPVRFTPWSGGFRRLGFQKKSMTRAWLLYLSVSPIISSYAQPIFST